MQNCQISFCYDEYIAAFSRKCWLFLYQIIWLLSCKVTKFTFAGRDGAVSQFLLLSVACCCIHHLELHCVNCMEKTSKDIESKVVLRSEGSHRLSGEFLNSRAALFHIFFIRFEFMIYILHPTVEVAFYYILALAQIPCFQIAWLGSLAFSQGLG